MPKVYWKRLGGIPVEDTEALQESVALLRGGLLAVTGWPGNATKQQGSSYDPVMALPEDEQDIDSRR